MHLRLLLLLLLKFLQNLLLLLPAPLLLVVPWRVPMMTLPALVGLMKPTRTPDQRRKP